MNVRDFKSLESFTVSLIFRHYYFENSKITWKSFLRNDGSSVGWDRKRMNKKSRLIYDHVSNIACKRLGFLYFFFFFFQLATS